MTKNGKHKAEKPRIEEVPTRALVGSIRQDLERERVKQLQIEEQRKKKRS